MRIELRPRDRRALLVGGIVLVPLLVGRLLVLPGLAELAAVRKAVATERGLLARERTLLVSAPAYSARADRLIRSLAAHAPRLFGPAEPPEPYIRRIAEDRNVMVEAIGRIPATADSAGTADGPSALVRPVLLHVSGESDVEGVLSFMGALREDEHLFAVELIDLRLREPDEARAPETVRMELRLRALLASGKAGSPAP